MHLEGDQPYHAKLFPIPKVREETLTTEVHRLVYVGDFCHKNYS